MDKTNILELIAQLDTSSDKSAEKVIEKILKIGKPTVSLLIAAARDKSAPRIRKWSLQALGALDDKRAAPVLVEALKEDRMTVKLHAIKGLRRMKYKNAIPEFIKLLKDESGGIRLNAMYALIELGDATAAAPIHKSLNDSQWYIRQNACIACGKLAITKSKKKLTELAAKDPKLAVRKAAQEALRLI